MADFSQEVSLTLEIPTRELSSARSQIEDALSDIPVSLDSGPAERASRKGRGGGGGGEGGGGGRTGFAAQTELMRRQLTHQKRSADLDEETGAQLERLNETATDIASQLGEGGAQGARQTRRWARQRTEDIGDILDILLNMQDGGGFGGGGGGAGVLGGARSAVTRISGSLPAILGGVSLGSLITRVPLRSLITRAPAFATLVQASDLAGELVTGKLGADDLISAPIEVGDMVTFGLLDNTALEAAIGTVTLSIGTYQIGSIVAGQLSGTALAGYFGSIGIGAILTPLVAGTAAAGLAAYLGTVGINQVITGEINLGERIDPASPFADPDAQDPRTGTVGPTPQGRFDVPTPTRGRVPEGFEDLSPAEQQEVAMTVNNQFDVTVDNPRDRQEIVDEAVREVENNTLPEFRRELERGLPNQ